MTTQQQFQTLLHKFAPENRLESVTALKGGISAQTTLLETVSAEDEVQKFVVRQHGENDRAMNAHIARDEFRLLDTLQGTPVSAPAPVAVDVDTFEFPCVILEYIEGITEIDPTHLDSALAQMAQALADIHSIPSAETTFSWLPNLSMRFNYLLRERSNPFDESLNEERIVEALKPVWEFEEVNGVSLLHGDYWASNILWRERQLVAVIDWEDAMLGNPLADLGDARITTLWAHGQTAMHGFTEYYQKLMPHLDYAQLPYWDLCAALRPISQFSDWASDYHEPTMRQDHHWFVQQALNTLKV